MSTLGQMIFDQGIHQAEIFESVEFKRFTLVQRRLRLTQPDSQAVVEKKPCRMAEEPNQVVHRNIIRVLNLFQGTADQRQRIARVGGPRNTGGCVLPRVAEQSAVLCEIGRMKSLQPVLNHKMIK